MLDSSGAASVICGAALSASVGVDAPTTASPAFITCGAAVSASAAEVNATVATSARALRESRQVRLKLVRLNRALPPASAELAMRWRRPLTHSSQQWYSIGAS